MLRITVEVIGTKRVMQKLETLGKAMYDMKRAMREIGKQAADYYANKGFNSRGGVFGNRWAPLSSRYSARKQKFYRGKGILEASGAMRDSFVSVSTRSSATITNSAGYFKYHQSTLPRKRLPRRQMMGVNSAIKSMIKREIESEIRRKLRTA